MGNNQIIMYQTEDGLTKIDVKVENDTVWLNQDQMAELFQRDKSTISRHIKNIFEERELNKESVTALWHVLSFQQASFPIELSDNPSSANYTKGIDVKSNYGDACRTHHTYMEYGYGNTKFPNVTFVSSKIVNSSGIAHKSEAWIASEE